LIESKTNIDLPKIVIVTSRFPHPLDKGDKLRIYHHIKQAAEYFRITLICLNEDHLKEESIDAIAPYCDEIHSFHLPKKKRIISALQFFAIGKPMQVGYFYNRGIKERIDAIINELKPDHIHCHMIRMAPYISFELQTSYSIDYMDSMILNDMAGQHIRGIGLSFIRSIERKRIANYELSIHGNFKSHFIISERDKKHIHASVRNEVEILSNGVELLDFEEALNSEKKYDLCFCGNLGYVPNKQAIAFILSELRPSLSSLDIIIAGAEASIELSQKADKGLSILSPVIDMRIIYQQSRILIAPIFSGSGQQNKILEAMALGVPCITTSFVNENIGANNEEQIILADTANGFIESVKVLLSRPELYAKISRNGRSFVEDNFSWENNTKPLIEAIRNH